MKLNVKRWGWALFAILAMTACKKEEEEDPNAPDACFIIPAEVIAGQPAMFNSSCSVNALAFSWDFGEGGSSSEAIPTYTFTAGGEYSVTLTVNDGMGGTDEISQTVIVQTPSVIEHSGTISSDETWIEATHLITGDVYVNGANLTIEPGAVVTFASGTGIYIGYSGTASGATLIAEGTESKPITFTSAAATRSPGDWDFIGFYDGASSQSVMQYCVVEYGGGYSDSYGSIHMDASSASIEQSTIRYSEYYGISLSSEGYFESFTGNTMMENGGHAISIYGNHAHTIGTGNSIQSVSGIRVAADQLEKEEATWAKQTAAYFLDGDLYVGSNTGSTLTLSPGVEIRVGGGSGIYVGYYSGTFGTLKADGTEDERIKITSSASEATRSPGDWDYIGFYDGAGSNSSITYCDIEFGGGYSDSYGMVYLRGSTLSVTHSSFSNSEFMGISLENDAGFQEFSDNIFDGNGTYPIEIFANYAHTIGSGNIFESTSGILVQRDEIEQADVTWSSQDVPYILDGYVYLGSESGAKLTIEPGTVIKFTEGSGLYVGYYSGTFGVLSAIGQSGNPITFTSGAPSGFESAGDWRGIWFYDGTGNNTILEHCVVSYAGGNGGNSGNLNVVNENPGVPEITSCTITNSSAYGVYMNNNSEATLTDVNFENNASGDTNK